MTRNDLFTDADMDPFSKKALAHQVNSSLALIRKSVIYNTMIDYISLNQCSELTGIPPSTIISYRKRGVFVAVHLIAGKKCYARQDVLKWKRPLKGKPGPKPRGA